MVSEGGVCTFPFFAFRVRPMETLPDSGTAKGCDTEELLLEGITGGQEWPAVRMDEGLDASSLHPLWP